MKKFFALYVVAILAVVGGMSAAKAGTIAHWTFEEGVPGGTASGAGSIIDIAGGNNGTPNGGPGYVAGNSSFGTTALKLDGVNDSVQIASGSAGPLALGQNSDFTIEVGIRTASGGSNGFPVFYGDPSPGKDPYYLLVAPNGNVTFHIYDGSGDHNLHSGAGALAAGKGSTIAAVFDYDDVDGNDNMMLLYIEQTLVASLNVGTSTPFYGDNTSDLWFGSVHDQGGFVDAALTDVRISDEALGPESQLQVPEPGTLALFGLGLLGLGLSRRKRA